MSSWSNFNLSFNKKKAFTFCSSTSPSDCRLGYPTSMINLYKISETSWLNSHHISPITSSKLNSNLKTSAWIIITEPNIFWILPLFMTPQLIKKNLSHSISETSRIFSNLTLTQIKNKKNSKKYLHRNILTKP